MPPTQLDTAYKELEKALKAIEASVPPFKTKPLMTAADDPEERLDRIEATLKAIGQILELGRPR